MTFSNIPRTTGSLSLWSMIKTLLKWLCTWFISMPQRISMRCFSESCLLVTFISVLLSIKWNRKLCKPCRLDANDTGGKQTEKKHKPFTKKHNPLSSFSECCYLLWANGLQLHNCAATSTSKPHTHMHTRALEHSHSNCSKHNTVWKSSPRQFAASHDCFSIQFNLTDPQIRNTLFYCSEPSHTPIPMPLVKWGTRKASLL